MTKLVTSKGRQFEIDTSSPGSGVQSFKCTRVKWYKIAKNQGYIRKLSY